MNQATGGHLEMAYQPQSNGHWASNPGYMQGMAPAMSNIHSPQVQQQPQHQHQPYPQPSSGPPLHRLDQYRLVVIQQPVMAKAANGKEKDRKPIDPPPIIRLSIAPNEDAVDPDGVYRQSPYLIVVAYLEYGPHSTQSGSPPSNMMAGTTVSSLHRLKDPSNKEGAFFIFGDLTVRSEGFYRLKFDLLQMVEPSSAEPEALLMITSAFSEEFRVHTPKNFPGMAESTFLTRSFSDQGVRLRLRKDSRQLVNKKRGMRTTEGLEGAMRKQTESKTSPAQNAPIPVQQQLGERFYDTNPYPDPQTIKRQRTESVPSINPGTPTTSEGRTDLGWAYPPPTGHIFSAHRHMTTVSSAPGTSTSLGAPMMPPPPGAIDTNFSSYTSPTGERQSPLNQSPMHQSPIQFGHAGSHNAAPHPYLFTATSSGAGASTLHMASMGSHQHSAMGTPILQNVSPGTHNQLNGSNSTGTPSPIGANIYTTAQSATSTPQPIQTMYAHAAAYQNQPNAFDHGTLREHGIRTPLTGNTPPAPYMDGFGGHIGSKQDHSA